MKVKADEGGSKGAIVGIKAFFVRTTKGNFKKRIKGRNEHWRNRGIGGRSIGDTLLKSW